MKLRDKCSWLTFEHLLYWGSRACLQQLLSHHFWESNPLCHNNLQGEYEKSNKYYPPQSILPSGTILELANEGLVTKQFLSFMKNLIICEEKGFLNLLKCKIQLVICLTCHKNKIHIHIWILICYYIIHISLYVQVIFFFLTLKLDKEILRYWFFGEDMEKLNRPTCPWVKGEVCLLLSFNSGQESL